MEMVINGKTDDYLWIPVAKENRGKPARAFLPVDGLDHLYGWGYKAEIEKDNYLDALIGIQRAFKNNERKKFGVTRSGKKVTEEQRRYKWDDYSSGRALLSPTMGWVKIPQSILLSVSAEELASLLASSGSEYAQYEDRSEPIICRTREAIESKLGELRSSNFRPKSKGQKIPKKISRTITAIERDAGVVYDVLKEAKGICESCSSHAPFMKTDGSEFLEVHHVKPLSKCGTDTFENAVALCPNCHRELHHGRKSNDKREKLYESVVRLIRE